MCVGVSSPGGGNDAVPEQGCVPQRVDAPHGTLRCTCCMVHGTCTLGACDVGRPHLAGARRSGYQLVDVPQELSCLVTCVCFRFEMGVSYQVPGVQYSSSWMVLPQYFLCAVKEARYSVVSSRWERYSAHRRARLSARWHGWLTRTHTARRLPADHLYRLRAPPPCTVSRQRRQVAHSPREQGDRGQATMAGMPATGDAGVPPKSPAQPGVCSATVPVRSPSQTPRRWISMQRGLG